MTDTTDVQTNPEPESFAATPLIASIPALSPAPMLPSSNAPADAASQTSVFRPVETSTPLEELSDSAFEPTPAEVQAAYLAATGRQQANSFMRTSAMRAKDEAKNQKPKPSWPTTKIRIKFSDRTQIERSFPSNSPMTAVYSFVRESLADDHKSAVFTLYQPPRSNLPEHPPPPNKPAANKRARSPPPPPPVSLLEHGLTPSSVLLIRFDDEDLNSSTRPAPLLSSLLSHATDLPDPTAQLPAVAASSTAAEPSAEPAKPKEKKIPAWLLKGLKKK